MVHFGIWRGGLVHNLGSLRATSLQCRHIRVTMIQLTSSDGCQKKILHASRVKWKIRHKISGGSLEMAAYWFIWYRKSYTIRKWYSICCWSFNTSASFESDAVRRAGNTDLCKPSHSVSSETPGLSEDNDYIHDPMREMVQREQSNRMVVLNSCERNWEEKSWDSAETEERHSTIMARLQVHTPLFASTLHRHTYQV